MTIYYGVWSGDGWWYIGDGELFYTAFLAPAKAQAMVADEFAKREFGEDVFAKRPHWEARTIGEAGLPRQRSRLIVYEPCDRERGRIGCVCPRCELERSVAESNATKLTEAAAPRQCAMCGEPAKEYVDVHIRGWMCEQHSHVSVGCLSAKEEPLTGWVTMEPFCPDCHAWLEMQDDVHMLLCPGCGKTLQDTEAPRRGRRNHESR